MASAEFTESGVTAQFSKEEWWFISSAMSFLLHGERMADHDFRNILMMDVDDAERLHDSLEEFERQAQQNGNHWNPRPN